MLISRNAFCLFAGLLAALAPAANAQTPANDAPPPVTYASVNELNNILAQVRETAQKMDADLAKTRVEKWKTDNTTKQGALADIESIRRNLQLALPEMLTALNNSPENAAATFTLYRNLDALYDRFGSFAELAGAFGSKDEYQSLSNDTSALQSARHALGERMQNLATAKENELTRLRNQVKAMQAAIPPPPPKKVIVDDTEPPKKPVKKKPVKPAATPPAAATPQSTQPK